MVPRTSHNILWIISPQAQPIWSSTLSHQPLLVGVSPVPFAEWESSFRFVDLFRMDLVTTTGYSGTRAPINGYNSSPQHKLCGNSGAFSGGARSRDHFGLDRFCGGLCHMGLDLFGDPDRRRIFSAADAGRTAPLHGGNSSLSCASLENRYAPHTRALGDCSCHGRSAFGCRQWRCELGGT